ncbi:unnamed protein product [Spirodela intermedia]|uniref:Potassium channel domain-containing protein n=1 Tax=Spirodela intermedia TaxID=51605 RepID=A0A7I8KIT7_SPIIN|nr:unnamed protein product [Spirodela intermedia]
MEEPLLPTTAPPSSRRRLSPPSNLPPPVLCPLPEDEEADLSSRSPGTPSSLKERLIYGPHPAAGDPHAEHQAAPPPASRYKPKLHRCRTAPSMAPVSDAGAFHGHRTPEMKPGSTPVIRQAVLLLAVYLALGVVVFTFNREAFSGEETHPVVDAVYFCIVTMCTIGYGDITPQSSATKIFSVAFVLVGFGFVDVLLSGMVSYVLDLQESLLLGAIKEGKAAPSYLVDVKKGRMRIRTKVAAALGVVLLCVGGGAAVMHHVERLGWLDSFYLAVMSVTTVGYGDRAFRSLPGRAFACVWLLVSTLAVARAFLYLAEARIDKRHRRIAKWVLRRDMTAAEFLAADIDHNGSLSKSEFVIYKLKEMGKITELDLLPICDQFERLDKGNSGKITLSHLTEIHQ